MNEEKIWAYLVHLSYNMWIDWEVQDSTPEHISAKPYLRFDDELWEELIHAMSDAGVNMAVLDLGDGVRYESHPEISVEGAWTTARLHKELERLRNLGIEPIPKLNFSTAHDTWLGEYSRCVSTKKYYEVCANLIAEVIGIFECPRFFHLGMDEETYEHQQNYEYVVVRQFDLWWRDFYFLAEQVEKAGTRACVWSDYLWHHPETFWEKMPRSVLQSNWYYGEHFSADIQPLNAYVELDQHGYDQIPTGSNWCVPTNFEDTVAFCQKNIRPQHLLGFIQTSWKPTLKECRRQHLGAIEQIAKAISKYRHLC